MAPYFFPAPLSMRPAGGIHFYTMRIFPTPPNMGPLFIFHVLHFMSTELDRKRPAAAALGRGARYPVGCAWRAAALGGSALARAVSHAYARVLRANRREIQTKRIQAKSQSPVGTHVPIGAIQTPTRAALSCFRNLPKIPAPRRCKQRPPEQPHLCL